MNGEIKMSAPAGTPRLERFCRSCLKPTTALQEGQLRRCTGCLAVNYCSVECQRKNWPTHRSECRKAGQMFTHIQQLQQGQALPPEAARILRRAIPASEGSPSFRGLLERISSAMAGENKEKDPSHLQIDCLLFDLNDLNTKIQRMLAPSEQWQREGEKIRAMIARLTSQREEGGATEESMRAATATIASMKAKLRAFIEGSGVNGRKTKQ